MSSRLARSTVWLLPLLIVLSAAGITRAEHIDHTITFSEQDLTLTRSGAYDVVALEGCDVMRTPGRPQLPVSVITLALPPDSRVMGLEILDAESRELLDRVLPLPAQHPRILPVPGAQPTPWRFTDPDPSVYSGEAPYPSDVVRLVSVGRLGANAVVGLEVTPVQYLPDSGRLRMFSRLDVRVYYEAGDRPADSVVAGRLVPAVAKDVVANPSGISPAPETSVRRRGRLDPGFYDYVIVTDPGYVASFQPLAQWKTQKGVRATIVTVDWIDSNYAGPDLQSRIRAFIADAATTWGATWFLLGGDTQVIPARRAYAMTSEAGMRPDEDDIGCDLYYSDLDGDWDRNGNGVYGETADDVDLYPDVFVGRASVRTDADVQAFVQKVLAWERGPAPGVGLDMLMAGEILWTDPLTDSGVALNVIDRRSVPPRYDPIDKLYESQGNETVASVTAALNEGQGHFLHSGHAWFTVMGCGEGYLDRNGAAALTNAEKQPIVYSIGCWPAAFDLEDDTCIAENFMRNPAGGSVAFIGNSRYGWAAPGNPGFGYSERFMQAFYDAVYTGGVDRLGAALAVAKACFIPLSRQENVYRWHQYELNLLGDPEMPVWTDEPEALEVSHPETLAAAATAFDVSVWTQQGPVEGALVCVEGPGGLYERKLTGPDGIAVLPLQLAAPGDVGLTVTAHDCMPYETTVPVASTGVFVSPSEITIDDSAGGNGDDLPGPGETVAVAATLANLGTETASAVEAVLQSDDPMLRVLSDVTSYGDIDGGALASPSVPFEIAIDEDCPNGHVALLDLLVESGGVRTTWTSAVTIEVAAPVVVVSSWSMDDSGGGDGDGTPEPGETVELTVELRNDGLAVATALEVVASSADACVTAGGDPVQMGDLQAGASAFCVLSASISSSCPVPSFPDLTVDVSTSDGFLFSDDLGLVVGDAGLFDDFEGGGTAWAHSGSNDLWRTTTHRSHSGTSSWYSGSDVSWTYQDSMNASLVSPEFVAVPGSELTFWCWYEFPTYHQDGLYVELLAGGAPFDTLDFLGSGGALGQLGTIGNDWLEYSYAIEGARGETLQVRFRFVSDASDVAEGVYLDDVAVTAGPEATDSGVDEDPVETEEPAVLHQNRPNPFTPYTMIGFSTRRETPVMLAVYNIQGRLIRTLLSDTVGPGEHSTSWDGKDELGVDVAAGVYMCRLVVGEFEDTRKMILIR